MISFDLSDEHKEVERTVRQWAAAEVAPQIHDLDRAHRFERKFLDGMADLQLLGICIPEEYGGAGLDYISLGLVSEELEYVDTHLRVIMSVHVGLNCMTLMCWGTEEQKQKYLVPQAQGKKIATYGLTEPNAGSDAVGIQSTAVKKGDRYLLNGEKVWISLADVADHFLVIAWTDQEKKKNRDHSGLSAFIVERTFKGFSSYSIKEKWGILAGNTGGFSMQDVEVPVAHRLGCGADPRRKRIFGRVSRRPLLPQLQGRGHLRGHPRDPQDHAGRLRPRFPPGQAAARRAAGLQEIARSIDASRRPLSGVREGGGAGCHRRRPHHGPGRPQVRGPGGRGRHAQGDGVRRHRRHHRHRRRRARRSAHALRGGERRQRQLPAGHLRRPPP